MDMKIRLTEGELIKMIKEIIKESEQPPILLPVPHYLQSDDSTCGPASLRMVMAFYGLEISEEDLAIACGHTYELGCRSEDMACAAKAMGFDVHLKNNSTIEELSRLVNAGAPVIVDWFCGDPPEGHSSVVIGVSDTDIYILDPFLEEMRVVAKEDFRRCWFDFYETPITPDNLYVGQIMVLRPTSKVKKNFDTDDEVEQIESKEGELKERCWKGYTQKGMKTMFGKKYPNCVKSKK